ncbi:MAG: GPW/gp25 family protein [Pseudomonadota bacterium]
MIGVDAGTGQALSGPAHLAQSIQDILTTPIGTRVMRRTYGSRVPDLIDAPLTGPVILEFYGAVAEALAAWEPRVTLEQIEVVSTEPGAVEVELSGTFTDLAGDAGAVIDGALAGGGGTRAAVEIPL